MPARRQERVGELLKQEISRIILFELRDPGLGFVTVTNVAPSPDLSRATVFVSILGGVDTQERTIAALQRARGRIQAKIGKGCRLRKTPRLSFHSDVGVKKSSRISEILSDLSPSEPDSEEQRRQEDGT